MGKSNWIMCVNASVTTLLQFLHPMCILSGFGPQ